VLSTELMTGYISGGNNPLSRITIGAMLDLGYQVNFGAADAYLLPGASVRMNAATPPLEMRELPMPPPRVVH
ncbi:MAG: peptidase, partial [Gemmatimonadetes bacterium]|nr:peptidase [Gemmatimonadota bacterium]